MLEEEVLSDPAPATNGNGAGNVKPKRGRRAGSRNPKAGRGSKLTTEFIHKVEQLAAKGLNQRQIAHILNVGPCTLSIWKASSGKLEEKFQKALSVGEAIGVKRRLERIEKAGKKGSWQADAWLLERRQPEQFGRRDSVRVSDPNGNALPAATTTVIAPTVVFVQPGKEELTNITDVQQITNGNGNGGGH